MQVKDPEPGQQLIEALLIAYDEWREAWQPSDPPSPLLHFTDCTGLCGILGSGKIWASMATAMNDFSEMQYGMDLAASTIGRMSPDSSFLALASKWLQEPLWSGPTTYPFVVSLCDNANQSLHWSHYGQSGEGVAIGFSTRDLVERLTRHDKLVRVIYDPAEQTKMIIDLTNTMHDIVDTYVAENPIHRERIEQDGAKILSGFIRILAVGLKDPCFDKEGEWRLIFTRFYDSCRPGPSHTKFRNHRGRVVPYLEIDLASQGALLPVHSIELGSSSRMKHNDPGLEFLVRGANPGAKITTSSIPLR